MRRPAGRPTGTEGERGLYGRGRMMKRRIVLLFVLFVALLWGGLFALVRHLQHRLNDRRPGVAVIQTTDTSGAMAVLWDAPPFSLIDQTGGTVTEKTLAGHPYVADFIYTQCTTACPVITSKLLLVQKSVTSPEARFVSFSVDPGHDTPAALSAYRQLWHGDADRWLLLSTTDRSLKKVTAGFNVTAEQTDDVSNPILHSSLMFLVDAAGKVRGLYDSSDESALRKLIADFKSLVGQSAPTPTSVSTDGGGALFVSMGCLACHSQSKIAPPLASLYNSLVRLDDGRTVWADEAYLHESIVNPTAKVVAGYGKTMPNYQNFLTDAQVENLVRYVESQSGNPEGGHGFVAAGPATRPAVELLRDPVCKMTVRAESDAPHCTYHGRVLYFCSQSCLERFQKNPDRYPLTAEIAK